MDVPGVYRGRNPLKVHRPLTPMTSCYRDIRGKLFLACVIRAVRDGKRPKWLRGARFVCEHCAREYVAGFRGGEPGWQQTKESVDAHDPAKA